VHNYIVSVQIAKHLKSQAACTYVEVAFTGRANDVSGIPCQTTGYISGLKLHRCTVIADAALHSAVLLTRTHRPYSRTPPPAAHRMLLPFALHGRVLGWPAAIPCLSTHLQEWFYQMPRYAACGNAVLSCCLLSPLPLKHLLCQPPYYHLRAASSRDISPKLPPLLNTWCLSANYYMHDNMNP